MMMFTVIIHSEIKTFGYRFFFFQEYDVIPPAVPVNNRMPYGDRRLTFGSHEYMVPPSNPRETKA